MNHDLRATYELIQLLENSKSLSDRILDQISGISLIIDEKGQILRGNEGAADYLSIPAEELLGQNMSQFFRPETSQRFSLEFLRVISRDENEVEFELELDRIPGPSFDYHWHLQELKIGPDKSQSAFRLFSVSGKDISELKKALSSVHQFETDIQLTRTVQSLLLPEKNFFVSPHFALAGFYEPASIVGGDLWWHEILPKGELLLLMCDLTGHGMGPAMVTSLISGTFHTLKESQLEKNQSLDIEEIFAAFHKRLLSLPGTPFLMTSCALVLNPWSHMAQFFSCGAPPVVHFHKDNRQEFLMGSSSGLGGPKKEIYKTEKPYGPGDRFLMLTDGLLEDPLYKGRDGWKQLLKFMQARALKDVHTLTLEVRQQFAPPSKESQAKQDDRSDDKTFALIQALT